MSKTITGLFKVPGKPMETCTVENTLEALQELVGGYIATFTLADDCVLICNEEGRLDGLPANFELVGQLFVGPVFFCGTRNEAFASLTLSESAQAFLKKSVEDGDCFGRRYAG